MPPELDPAAPADATAGTQIAPDQGSQAPDSGQGALAHDIPDGQRQQADGEPRTEAESGARDAQGEKPSRYQRRVETLVDEVKSLQRQVEHFRTLAERGGAARRLDPLSFSSDAEYQRALIQETARQSQSEFARTQAQTAEQQARIVEQQIWDTRTADYREQVPDFDQVAYSGSVVYSPHGLQMVRQMPEGPQVAYFLGKTPAEAQRIANLSPLETAFELGRLAQRLKGPPRKAVSDAPNPVPTVRARAAATGFRPDSNDPDAYRAWRDKLPD